MVCAPGPAFASSFGGWKRRHQASSETCLPSGFLSFRPLPRVAHHQPHETDVAAQAIELVGKEGRHLHLPNISMIIVSQLGLVVGSPPAGG
jgi:hypothetical protein